MTRTSARWIIRLTAGIAGVAALSQPVSADGWLRSRLRTLCDNPSMPWARPAEPLYLPQGPPSSQVAPPTIVAPSAPPVKADVPAMPPPVDPRFEPLVSAALGEGAVAVAFNPARFG